MATTFEYISLRGLRKTHLVQLMVYIEWREREMVYYGNREQFEKRHEELKHWLQNAIDYANEEGVKFPKP